MSLVIRSADLDDARVQSLLAHHLETARAATAQGSAHALGLADLRAPEVEIWAAWEGDDLLGVGALKRLASDHGEIKSMHTIEVRRRAGVGRAILHHLLAAARAHGMRRLSLETGSWEYFEPARALYRSAGFVECPPFGDYALDPNSVFMTLELEGDEATDLDLANR